MQLQYDTLKLIYENEQKQFEELRHYFDVVDRNLAIIAEEDAIEAAIAETLRKLKRKQVWAARKIQRRFRKFLARRQAEAKKAKKAAKAAAAKKK